MDDLQKRKILRIENFDYSTPGAYFVTICTKDRKHLFSPVGADSISARMVKDGLLPPFNKQIWQRSFYDHVIRNQYDYDEIYKYICNNPLQWKYDKLYTEE